MPIIYNGVNVKKINYNGTALKQVYYNGVKVWQSGFTIIDNATTPDFGAVDMPPWVAYPWKNAESSTNGNIYVKFNTHWTSTGISIYGNNGSTGYNAAMCYTTTTAPTAEYSKIYITYNTSAAGSGKLLQVGLKSTASTTGIPAYSADTTTGSDVKKYFNLSPSTTDTTVNFDISDINENLYLYVRMHNPANTTAQTLNITKVWLE